MNLNRLSFAKLSIRVRLPLLICALLLVVITVLAFTSYLGVKKTALEIGKERLQTLSEQVSSTLTTSAKTAIIFSRAAVNQNAVKQLLYSNGKDSSEAAMSVLLRLRTIDTTIVLAEILDLNRSPLIQSARKDLNLNVKIDSVLPEITTLEPDSGRFGKLFVYQNHLCYPVIVAIADNNRTIGYLIRWKLMTNNPQAIEQISKLLGTEARLYVGNEDGKLWTDLAKAIEGPPLKTYDQSKIHSYRRDKGKPVIALIRPLPNSHWLLLVELSQEKVLETAGRSLYWIIFAGAIMLILGVFAAWIMSRKITIPLQQLTWAASNIAAGNYALPVQVDRYDELGKLSRSFNAMNAKVQHSQEELQKKMQNYRLLFENNPMPMWILSRASLAVLDVNEAAVMHYGYTKEEFLKLNAKDLRPENDVEKYLNYVETRPSGSSKSGIWRHKKKNGAIIMVDIIADDIVYNDEPARLVLANDVTEKLKAEAELSRQMLMQQKLITETTIQAQEKEREEIGKDLHDNINQILAATKLYLELALNGQKELVSEALMKSHNNVNLAITEIRQLSRQLVPPTLNETLSEALDELINEIQAASLIRIHKKLDKFEEEQLDGSLKLMLYRIIQEQVNNILKHSRAKNVHIDIETKNDNVFMSITDDGIGFDPAKKAKGIGLRNIASRVGFYNGVTNIISNLGAGCKLEVSIPLKQEVEEE